jgi:hypothetical protein
VEEVVVASLVSFASYIRSTRPTKQNAREKERSKEGSLSFLVCGTK